MQKKDLRKIWVVELTEFNIGVKGEGGFRDNSTFGA